MKRPPMSERSDWTEMDLLTRDEATGRLRDDITETSARLAELGVVDEAERALLQARLRTLHECLEALANPTTENGVA